MRCIAVLCLRESTAKSKRTNTSMKTKFKIFGALSKDTFNDIYKYFGIWTIEEQIFARRDKLKLR